MKALKYLGFAVAGYVLLAIVTALFNVGLRAQEATKPGEKEPKWRAIDQSQYVGSERCAECHVEHFDGWKGTLHAKMIQRPVAEGPDRTIDADFSQESEHRDFKLADVKLVIGSRWKQRFVGEIDGEEVVFPAQWSVRDKIWMPYLGRTDWWYPYHKDWKKRSVFQLCDGCHTTGADHYSQSWTELNISCESCHGPGKAHSEDSLHRQASSIRLACRWNDLRRSVCPVTWPGSRTERTTPWAVGYQPGMVLADFWEWIRAGQKGTQSSRVLGEWHRA